MYIIHHKSINNIVIERNGSKEDKPCQKYTYNIWQTTTSITTTPMMVQYCSNGNTKVISKCLKASYSSHLEMVSKLMEYRLLQRLTVHPAKFNLGGGWKSLCINECTCNLWSKFFVQITLLLCVQNLQRHTHPTKSHALIVEVSVGPRPERPIEFRPIPNPKNPEWI